MALPPYVVPSGADTVVHVFVQPKAAVDAIVGIQGAALKLKVKAPPIEGRANAAACKLLARALGISPSRVTVIAGGSSRNKRVTIAAVSSESVARELVRVLSSRAHGSRQEVRRQENRGQEDKQKNP